MRRGEGVLLAALLAVGLVVLPATTTAAACGCKPPPVTKSLAEEQLAQEVFTGRVTASAPLRRAVRLIDVEVDEVFRGKVGTTVSVEAGSEEPPCGFDPPVGADVLLYTVKGSADMGRDQGDATVVLPCVGGRDAEEAAVLGTGRSPPTTGTEWESSGPSAGTIVLAVAVVGVLVVLVGRRARRRRAT